MIYLDNQATTRVDPAVVSSIVKMMESSFANPGSATHIAGREAADLVEVSIQSIAHALNAERDEIVITSGATESNNLAIFGAMLHPKQSRRKIVTIVTEHRAVLDPMTRLQKLGFEVIRLGTRRGDSSGLVDLDECLDHIDESVGLVSIMLANNEIGTIQPIAEIAAHCKKYGVIIHTDAAQAIGKLPVDVQQLGVDLLSFSAHKFYGPKGVGGLFVRQSPTSTKIQPMLYGGGQQSNLRSGTLNSAGIVGMATALELCTQRSDHEIEESGRMRQRLWDLLKDGIPDLLLNGPDWTLEQKPQALRLAGNLNVCFPKVEGQSLMLALPELAVSSGSACTSADPNPSHVLAGIGRTLDQSRASLRFGIGRFNTMFEIETAAKWLIETHAKLTSFAA